MPNVIGLDIGTSHIKAVEIEKKEDQFILNRYAVVPQKRVFADVGFWEMDDVKEAGKLLKSFLSDYKFTAGRVVAVIPESLTFNKILTLPILKGKDLDEALKIEAKQHVPYPVEELYLKYEILSKALKFEDEGKMKLLLAAVRKKNIDRYLKVIENSSKLPSGIEPSSVSTVRSLINGPSFDLSTLIINVGYQNIDFYYVVDRKFVYARTVGFGISSIIKAISVNLNVSNTKAIQYLYTYGLKENALDGKLFKIIEPGIGVLISELEKSERYIMSRDVFTSKDGNNVVRRILFTGGGALIPNLLGFMPRFTDAEIALANTWVSVNIKEVSNYSELDRVGPLFSSAVGAAMKSI